MKKFLVVLLFGVSFCLSCKGIGEQPKFVSIFSGERNSGGVPVLTDFSVQEENTIILDFEGEVAKIEAVAVRANSEEKIDCKIEPLSNKTGKKAKGGVVQKSRYKVIPSGEFKIGEAFELTGSVEATDKSVLDFTLALKGQNSKPAKLIFTQIKFGSTKNYGFIKFKVVEGGNLFGLKLLMPANSKAAEYSFPIAEVKKGENIAYHWFLGDGQDSAVDEVNFEGECVDKWAFRDARDFWGNFKKFTPKRSNALVLKTSDGGDIQDAVLILNPKEDNWGKEEISAVAEEAGEAGFWQPDGEAENALKVNITPSKMIVRANLNKIKHTASEWSLQKAPKKPKK